MADLPSDRLYTKEHEWLRLQDDGTAVIGITEYAQQSLGDITFVEFPEVGSTFAAGETFGVVESVKAASDLYMPIDGEVTAINEAVDASPELVNQSAFSEGWLLKIRVTKASQLEGLLSAEAYAELV